MTTEYRVEDPAEHPRDASLASLPGPDPVPGQVPAVLRPMEIAMAATAAARLALEGEQRYAKECRLADLEVVRRAVSRHLKWGDEDVSYSAIIREAMIERQDDPIVGWAFEIGMRRGASIVRSRVRQAIDDLVAMIK